MRLAGNINILRKKCGMTQERLAEECHVSRGAFIKWERGESEPSVSNLVSLSEILGVSLDELVFGDFGKVMEDEEEYITISRKEWEELMNVLKTTNSKKEEFDVYKAYVQRMNSDDCIDTYEVEGYVDCAINCLDEGDYEKAIHLFEESLIRGNIFAIDSILEVYKDRMRIIEYIEDDSVKEEYWRLRLEMAQKMKKCAPIVEDLIKRGYVIL